MKASKNSTSSKKTKGIKATAAAKAARDMMTKKETLKITISGTGTIGSKSTDAASERLAEIKLSTQQKGVSSDEESQQDSEGSESSLEPGLADYSKLRSSSKSAKASINRSYNQAASIATRSQTEKMKTSKN